MRIAFFMYGNLDMPSGGFLYDRMVVEHLRNAGHRIDEISLPWLDYDQAPAGARQASAQLDKMDSDDYDLILQDELANPVLCRLNRQIRKWRVPIVAIVHNLRCSEREDALPKRLRAAFYEAVYLSGVDGIIVNSSTTWRSVRRLLFRRKPFIIARPGGDRFRSGFDVETVKRKCHEPGPLRVFFAANVLPRKGLHVLLAALEKMRLADWELSIAGSWDFDPEYAVNIRTHIRSKGLEGKIKIYGNVRESGRMKNLYESSHVLAVPSSYEGFGIIFAEALGFGVPVAACRTGAVPELIRHGENGFLVRPGDSSGLARSLSALHHDRELLLKMSLSARRSFLDLPGWEQGLVSLRVFLEGMAGGPSQ